MYTTRIQSNSSFMVYRRFPPHVAARIPVSGNQTLSPVQIVAQTSDETGYEIVPIAEVLGVKNGDLPAHLSVKVGDLVRSGTVLAERKKMFGRSIDVASPVEGTVAEIHDGNLFITRIAEDLNLRALVHGKVAQVIPGKGAILQVSGSRFQAVWNNGVEGAGKLQVLGDTGAETLQAEHLDVDLYNTLVAVGHLDRPELLPRLVESGASGLIIGTISPDAFQAALGWQYPLTLTDGAGHGGIYHAIFELLCENNGNHTALFNNKYSQTNRPDVVIVKNDLDEADGDSGRTVGRNTPLAAGEKVRLLTGSHRGQAGVVHKTYDWPRTTPTGFKAEGVDVRFSDGKVTFVPMVNLDRIM